MIIRWSPMSASRLAASYMIAAFILGFGGFTAAFIRITGSVQQLALIPTSSVDDRIYNILITQPSICIQNLTSTLAEGGCRIQLLWTVSAYAGKFFGLQMPGALAILLRITLISLIGLALYFFNRLWCQQTHINPDVSMMWIGALIVAMPVPLLFLGLGHELVDASLILAALASPPNLFSILMSIVCAGGLFIYHNNPAAWSWIGILAGIWAWVHPYYIYFWLTLACVWIIQMRQLSKANISSAALLIVPTLVAGGYYAWLAQSNHFFQYHLAHNITNYSSGTVIPLIIGIILSLVLAVLILYKDGIEWRDAVNTLGPSLISWLAVSGAWAVIPMPTVRRASLVVLVPLCLAVARLAALPNTRLFRRYITTIIILNMIVLTLTSYVAQSPYLASDLRARVVTPADREFATYLSSRPQDNYIGSPRAVIRFPWLSRTRMLNVQIPESPDYTSWNKVLASLSAQSSPCNSLLLQLRQGRVAGIILDTATHQREIAAAKSCGFIPAYSNSDWMVMSPFKINPA